MPSQVYQFINSSIFVRKQSTIKKHIHKTCAYDVIHIVEKSASNFQFVFLITRTYIHLTFVSTNYTTNSNSN